MKAQNEEVEIIVTEIKQITCVVRATALDVVCGVAHDVAAILHPSAFCDIEIRATGNDHVIF